MDRHEHCWDLLVAAILNMAFLIMHCSTCYPRGVLLAAADNQSHDLRRHALWGLVNLSSSGNADANHESMWEVLPPSSLQLTFKRTRILLASSTHPSKYPPVQHTLNPCQDAHGARRVMLRCAAARAPEDQEARMLAVWALCNLALRDASRQSMWEDAETRDALLGCIAESEPQILRVQALRALTSLAAHETNRVSMLSALRQARAHCVCSRHPRPRQGHVAHPASHPVAAHPLPNHREMGYCGRWSPPRGRTRYHARYANQCNRCWRSYRSPRTRSAERRPSSDPRSWCWLTTSARTGGDRA